MMRFASLTMMVLAVTLSMPAAHAANCNAVAQSVAAQQNAQVISAKSADKNGQPVCEVVVLKSTGDGPRKRVTVVVPAS